MLVMMNLNALPETRLYSSEHKMAINFAEYDNLSIIDDFYVNNTLNEGNLIMEDN